MLTLPVEIFICIDNCNPTRPPIEFLTFAHNIHTKYNSCNLNNLIDIANLICCSNGRVISLLNELKNEEACLIDTCTYNMANEFSYPYDIVIYTKEFKNIKGGF